MVSTRPPLTPTMTTLVKPLLVGGAVLALISVWGEGPLALTERATTEPLNPPENCEAIIRSDARISRDQLANLLTIPERDPKDAVRKVVAEPYCRLPQLQVRSGVMAEREAYPLAFDPNTQLVILYEENEYAGYRFKFQ